MSGDLRERLRAAIDDAGRHQVTIADDLGVTTKHLCAMLTGRARLTLEWAERIAEACGREVVVAVVDPNGDLRERLGEALYRRLREQAGSDAGSQIRAEAKADDLVDAVLPVVEAETDRLNRELSAWRATVEAADELRQKGREAIARWEESGHDHDDLQCLLDDLRTVLNQPIDSAEDDQACEEIAELATELADERTAHQATIQRAERAESKVAGYESTIAWDTTCVEHARLLDACRTADERAEHAEDRLRKATSAYDMLAARADDAEATCGRLRRRREEVERERDDARAAAQRELLDQRSHEQRITDLEAANERLAEQLRRFTDACATCGCTDHSCSGDCDCCPRHRRDP